MENIVRMIRCEQSDSASPRRKGAILVLFAFLLIMIFGFMAFAVDVGYIGMVKTSLQNVADAAAMAGALELGSGNAAVVTAAQAVASANKVDAASFSLSASNIETGTFDLSTKTFTPTNTNPNAVRVTANVSSKPLFFAPVLGTSTYSVTTSAISMLNPRDIAFVVDLSGSMNDDSEPCWMTDLANANFASSGYPTIGTQLMQDVYTDFGYGTFPGTLEWVGAPLGVSANNNAYAQMTRDSGPLTTASIASTYKIATADSEATRKTKAYKWIIDNQILRLMPNAKPVPSSSNAASLAFWTAYLDYLLPSVTVSGSSASNGMPRRGSTASVTLPPSQDSERIDSLNNPNTQSYPSATVTAVRAFRNQIGYRTFVQFMMDFGRDRSPDVSNTTNSDASVGTKMPLSTLSPYCPFHTESTAGGMFSFPPREQPTHAVRRSLIAAIQVVKQQNVNISATAADQVSIVSFDAIDSYHTPVVRQALTNNYTAAMTACTTLQAVGDISASTATENGLIAAQAHIKPTTQGGSGRTFTHKVMVLITDGMPNIWQSSSSTISNYISNNPDPDYYSSGNDSYNSVLMQTDTFKGNKGSLFPVGMGLGADFDFMDRIARMAGTADQNGLSPRPSGNPAQYEAELTNIFSNIIQTPGVRLVK